MRFGEEMKIARHNGKKAILLGEKNMGICEYCGKIDDLRPYGKDGANICYDCGMLPENFDEVNKRINGTYNLLKSEIGNKDKPE